MLQDIIAQTKLGFCWWDIPAMLVLIAVIVVFIVKRHNAVKQEQDLQDQIEEKLNQKNLQVGSEME